MATFKETIMPWKAFSACDSNAIRAIVKVGDAVKFDGSINDLIVNKDIMNTYADKEVEETLKSDSVEFSIKE